MKILITGVSGFIGGRLLSSLVSLYGKNAIVAFTSKIIPAVNCVVYNDINNFNIVNYDFSDITHVVHAGAFTPKTNQQANNIKKSNGNIFFTENLLNINLSSLERIVFLSTLDVYEGQGVISESSLVKPVSLYGHSKLYCEEMVKSFALQENIEYLNLRIGHAYGPGEEQYKKILPLTINKILREEPVEIWGDGCELRSFIYVDDVVAAIVNAVNYSVANMDINVVSGNPISINSLVSKVVEISGKNISMKKIESNHIKRDLVFDNSKLMSTLLDKETDLDAGLKAEYDYMKNIYEHNI